MNEFVTRSVVYSKAFRKVSQEDEFTYETKVDSFQTDDEIAASIIVTPNHETIVIFEDGSAGMVRCEDDRIALKVAYNLAMIEHLEKMNDILADEVPGQLEIHKEPLTKN